MTAEVTSSTSISLVWQAPQYDGGSTISDYIIQYKLNNDSTWVELNDGTSTNLSATIPGLSPGQNYDFRVSAVNSNGAGPFAVTTKLLSMQTLPGIPEGFSATPTIMLTMRLTQQYTHCQVYPGKSHNKVAQ